MSMGSVTDAKFPCQHDTGIPPSPTSENPGQVYPQSDPRRKSSDTNLFVPGTAPGSRKSPLDQSLLGNPFSMRDALHKLDSALGNIIQIIEEEEGHQGGSQQQERFLLKFRYWRNELDEIRTGIKTPDQASSRVRPEQEGGMFTD